MKLFIAIALLFSLSACSHNRSRTPASVPKDLNVATSQFLKFVQSDSLTRENCKDSLHSIYAEVMPLQSDFFDHAKAIQDADQIMQNLWQARVALRARLADFAKKGTVSSECVNAIRDTFRMARFAEDYLGNAKLGFPASDENKPLTVFTGPMLLAPGINKLSLESGDIILSRGTAYTSSAIANIGDSSAQFSHISMVYIDEASGEQFTLEAHIEIGSKIFHLDEYIHDGKARAVVFRHPDRELAKLAAKKAYDLLSQAAAEGKSIPYNFTMDLSDRTQLFCSQLVEYGYFLAAKEQGKDFDMPLYKTTMYKMSQDFLKRFGINVKETFAPADMEVDTRFNIIAEWRDFPRMRQMHLQDAVLDGMYSWMENKGYKFRGDPINFIEEEGIWVLRRWPIFSKLLEDKIPTNMSPTMIGTILKLNSVAGALFNDLDAADQAYQKTHSGYPMTFSELETQMEQLRMADLARYTAHEKWQLDNTPPSDDAPPEPEAPKFHWDFRADN